MLEDTSVYKNTKRNEKCPCGSGKIFKKCCMEEYRQSKKQNVKLSSFSPLVPLSNDEQEKFTEFYMKLMVFSNQYKNKSEAVIIEDKKQNIQSFITEERVYFYENNNAIIDSYIVNEEPTKSEIIILEALRKGRLEEYYLLSKSENFAVIMDRKSNFYNIQALNSPFTEIFTQKLKYMGINTALIPYKDRFITDGIYQGFEVSNEIEVILDKIPYQNPTINYIDDTEVTGIQFAINFSIGCEDIDKFEEMEELLLKKIPNDFFKGLIKLFENHYSYKTSIFSSFLRSTDFLTMSESKDGSKTTSYIFGGAPVTNFESGNDDECIAYDILEHYYKQPKIEQSASYGYYKKSKDKENKEVFSTFYTILGISQIKKDDYTKFIEFLKVFKTKEKRKEVMIGTENLFDDLSEELNSEIYPVFLDVCVDLNEIGDEINLYHDYVTSLFLPTIEKMQKYSINKGKI